MRFAAIAVLAAPVVLAQSLAGTWQATVKVNGLEIPFRMEFQGSAAAPVGVFFNGDERFPSTAATFSNGSLLMSWDYLGGRIESTFANGARHCAHPIAREGA
jgi:hypothetical protein